MSRRTIIREFRGEDRYFGFFKKKGTVYFLVGVGIAFLFFRFGSSAGHPLLYLSIGLAIGALITAFGIISIPENLYLLGGGEDLDGLVFNLLKHKKNKCIYSKAYDFDQNNK